MWTPQFSKEIPEISEYSVDKFNFGKLFEKIKSKEEKHQKVIENFSYIKYAFLFPGSCLNLEHSLLRYKISDKMVNDLVNNNWLTDVLIEAYVLCTTSSKSLFLFPCELISKVFENQPISFNSIVSQLSIISNLVVFV
jgi:hypothetical protein